VLHVATSRDYPVPRLSKKSSISGPWDAEVRLLAWFATCASVIAFLFYFQQQQGMLYGDAVAHINIARRVFDSKTPGPLQLGTVWLPLPHLLMIPFLISNEMWRRGAGGSVPSLVAYTFAVIGLFRLLRGTLSRAKEPDAPARIAAGTAALILAANPNLLYMQSTAMGEALYLAFFIWSVVYFSEALRGEKNALTKCGVCLAAACLTRYDGWFLAAAMAVAAIVLSFRQHRSLTQSTPKFASPRAVTKFVLIAAAAPALWLAYNGIVYRNPLEFENGPYSAKAIEARTQNAGNPGHPGTGNLWVAGLYFLKSAEANVAENQWLQRAWMLALFAALFIAALAWHRRRTIPDDSNFRSYLPLLFLLIPLPFYALSVAYGGVPIFVPAWWPFTHYNVRYGLQLLPAFAASFAIILNLVLRIERWKLRLRFACVLAVLAFVGICYATIWRTDPVCLAEAEINMRARNQLESQLATWLEKLPPNSTLLMYLGDHVGAVQQAGIPLKQVINEGNHRVWKQPSDPDGLWERALADPTHYADYVVAFDGDRVWQAVQGQHLRDLVEIHVTGQPRVILYRAR
jgi:hypothetical protein